MQAPSGGEYRQVLDDAEIARDLQRRYDEDSNLYPNESMRQESDRNAVHENVRANINIVQEQSPRVLGLYMTYYVIEAIATIVILSLHWDQPCDRPLRWFVLIFTLRYLVLVPLRIFLFRQTDYISTGAEFARRMLTWMELFKFVWWIVGQVWLYGSDTCSDTNPGLYYYALTLIILVYVIMALPVLILLGLCICLPCVLVVLRMLSEPRGASETVIQKLPTRTYDVDPATRPANAPAPDPCAICRSDFAFGDELRVLPCRHEFHTGCVDSWLKINQTCPLCRAPITGSAPAAHGHAEPAGATHADIHPPNIV